VHFAERVTGHTGGCALPANKLSHSIKALAISLFSGYLDI
jgi:hypothetical protein